jgi:hypothetical protein
MAGFGTNIALRPQYSGPLALGSKGPAAIGFWLFAFDFPFPAIPLDYGDGGDLGY